MEKRGWKGTYRPEAGEESGGEEENDEWRRQQEGERHAHSLLKGKGMPQLECVPGLIGLDPLWDLLRLIVWTGRVRGESPVSVIIVAPPGSGKTSIIEKLHWDPFTHFSDDLTARELSKILNHHRHATHIILGDMMTLFAHKASVVSLTCSELRRCVEEGIGTDSFTGDTTEKRRKIGLITAIPEDDYKSIRVKRQLKEGGFASRFLVVRYQYRPETKEKIHDFIESNAYTESFAVVKPNLERSYAVDIPAEIAQRIRNFSVWMRQDPLGARAHHHIRALVKAAAIQNERSVVKPEDFDRVIYHSDFFMRERIL
jgi:hypothetical protein